MTIGWWIGNAAGIAIVVPLLVWLAGRLIRTSREIGRYAADIAEQSTQLAANLEPASALLGTRNLVGEVADSAGRYVAAFDASA